MLQLKYWLLDKFTYSSLNPRTVTAPEQTSGDENNQPFSYKRVKTHYGAFFLSTITMLLLTALTFIFLTSNHLTLGWKQSKIPKGRFSPISAERLGFIRPASSDHSLKYYSEARSASKKFYELISDSETTYYDDDNMVLGTNLFSPHVYSRQPYVANGYIGSRIPNIGFGYALDELNFWSDAEGALNNGWPLRNRRYAGAFVSDFYCLQEKLNSTNFPEIDEKGYPSAISSVPQWTNLQFSVNDGFAKFNPIDVRLDDVSNYAQNLSMKDGIVSTEMDWLNGTLHVRSDILAHRSIYPLGMMKLEVSLNLDNLADNFTSYAIHIDDILDFNTSHRTVLRDLGYNDLSQAIYMVVEPENVPYSNAAIVSTCDIELPIDNLNSTQQSRFYQGLSGDNDTVVSQTTDVNLTRDVPKLVVYKYVGIMSTEYSESVDDNLELALNTVDTSRGNFDELLSIHKRAWADLYNDAFIEIPSDSLLELTVRSSLYHLIANTRAHNVSASRGLKLPVSGLSSDSYAGLVFWDADTWVEPALLPFFPQIALNMNNFRNATHSTARDNAKEYGLPGAVYPWTAGRYSNCTSTGPCIDYEYHINVDIALSSLQIYLNGGEGIDDDYLRYTTWPLIKDAADFFTDFVTFNKSTGYYETKNLTDPDEFADHIDNGAFTNAGIKALLGWATDIGGHLNVPVDPKWKVISDNIYIPRSSSNITLEYSGMNSSIEIKQADVPLMIFPLHYSSDPLDLNIGIKDLYYYSERQSISGPAMTYPVFVAAASGLLNHGSSSQSYLYKSVLPYLRAPFAQFSEQSDDNFLTNGLTQPAFPFLTANGGFLQSILFGLTGIRYTYEIDDDTKQLQRVMKFDPVELPMLPGGIAIRNFKYMNCVFDIIIDDRNGTVVHKGGNSSVVIKVPNRTVLRDTDIVFYHPGGRNHYLQKRENPQIDIAEDGSGVYYILEPGQELVLPLFKPSLNTPGNIVESSQITNLTSGVPGDVAVSAVDGNNYTHWQASDKYSPGKLLIDLGENNAAQISGGMIFWGRRPAQSISLAILPHTGRMEEILSTVSEILENEEEPEQAKKVHAYLSSYLDHQTSDGKNCTADILQLLDWRTDHFRQFIENIPNISNLQENFVTILDHYQVEPSQPYFSEVIENDLIELLPSNVTEFKINYDNIDFSKSLHCLHNSTNVEGWKEARYVVLSVDGVHDEDDIPFGATIREIVLFK